MSKKARLASIGVGMIGEVHARTLGTDESIDYVAIADPDPGKRELADKYGVPFYTDYKEMLREVKPDGVIVAVPNDQHLAVGSYCAEQGIHIFMEKPITPTVEEGEQLIEAAEKHGVQLAVGHHRRFNPLMTAMKELISRGDLGRIVGMSMLWAMYKPKEYFEQGVWRTKPGGGPIQIHFSHEIDNLRYLYGEIASVYAEVSNASRGFEVEDTVGLTLRMKDGAIANILLSDTVPSIWSYEQTMAEFDHFYQGNGNIYHFFGDRGSIEFPDMVKVTYGAGTHWSWRNPVETERLDLHTADPYPPQMRHFANVVLGKEKPRTTGPDALQTLKVTKGVAESGAEHKPVFFD